MTIKVRYSSIDGARVTRSFKTIAGAQAYAQKWVGPTPEIGGGRYAVSSDGIGKVTADGVDLADLFPALKAPPGWGVFNYFDTSGQGFTLVVRRGNEVWGHYTDWAIAASAAALANEGVAPNSGG